MTYHPTRYSKAAKNRKILTGPKFEQIGNRYLCIRYKSIENELHGKKLPKSESLRIRGALANLRESWRGKPIQNSGPKNCAEKLGRTVLLQLS